MVSATSLSMLEVSVVSAWIAVDSPPASLISRSTVLMVDSREFGLGGNGVKE